MNGHVLPSVDNSERLSWRHCARKAAELDSQGAEADWTEICEPADRDRENKIVITEHAKTVEEDPNTCEICAAEQHDDELYYCRNDLAAAQHDLNEVETNYGHLARKENPEGFDMYFVHRLNDAIAKVTTVSEKLTELEAQYLEAVEKKIQDRLGRNPVYDRSLSRYVCNEVTMKEKEHGNRSTLEDWPQHYPGVEYSMEHVDIETGLLSVPRLEPVST